MNIHLVPTSSSGPWYSQTVTLSGTEYTLELRYNTRMGRWILNVGDAAGNIILAGVPMLINRNLNRQYTALQVPPGALVVMDTSGNNQQATLYGFLQNNALFYVDANA